MSPVTVRFKPKHCNNTVIDNCCFTAEYERCYTSRGTVKVLPGKETFVILPMYKVRDGGGWQRAGIANHGEAERVQIKLTSSLDSLRALITVGSHSSDRRGVFNNFQNILIM